jgi:DNA polymerase-1
MPNAHPRLLADFTGNQTLIDAVDGLEAHLETGDFIGEDFHTVNSVLFRLNTEEELAEARKTQDHDLIAKISAMRGKGKGGSFCTLYGGSAKKLAITIGIKEALGKEIMNNFLAGLGLDKLLAEIKETWETYKYKRGSFIEVLGGYWVFCNSEHKIINYKALGSEAVVQKMAVILIGRKMEALNLKTKLIVNYHDELLFDVPNNELDTMKELVNNMYPNAAKELGLTLDWSSYAMLGANYSECH